MQQFFVENEAEQNLIFPLSDDISHQMIKVLRYRGGETIRLIDSYSRPFLAQVLIEGKKAHAKIIEHLDETRENKTKTTLFLCRIKKDKFEWALQKATELGVSEIIPVQSRHVAVRRPYTEDKLRTRFAKIIKEASEQSERHICPRLVEDIEWEEIDNHLKDINLIAWERSDGKTPGIYDTLTEIKNSQEYKYGQIKSVSILIGPEGGLTKAEVDWSINRGFQAVSLGPRILRAETAAISALSAISQILE